MAIFEIQILPKLISRKIWVAVKLSNFNKVLTSHFESFWSIVHPKEFNTWRTSTSCTTLECPWHCLRRRISEEQSTRFDTILTAYSVPVFRSTHLRHTLKLPSPKIASLRSISYRWKKGEFWKKHNQPLINYYLESHSNRYISTTI